MTTSRRPTAKALTAESRSDAIVVSFGANWFDRLKQRSFCAVIRKRTPRTFIPRWMYIHVNAPKSSICARARIASIEVIPKQMALMMTRDLDLSEEKISAYIGGSSTVGLYRLNDISFPGAEVTAGEIDEHVVYYAPQSFFAVSREGKRVLDRLCGFEAESSFSGDGQ